jgi:hypothetical protein
MNSSGGCLIKWFKHYTNAHRGLSLQSILNEFGHIGTSCYWILVELCADKLDKNEIIEDKNKEISFIFDTKYLVSLLRLKQSTVGRLLVGYRSRDLLAGSCDDNQTIIKMPKLLEILNRDSKYARTRRAHDAPKRKNKNKEEDREAITADSYFFSSKISEQSWTAWKILYNDASYIETEIKAACVWLVTNSHKRPKKDFDRFFNSWLSRGWESYRIKLPSKNKSSAGGAGVF